MKTLQGKTSTTKKISSQWTMELNWTTSGRKKPIQLLSFMSEQTGMTLKKIKILQTSPARNTFAALARPPTSKCVLQLNCCHSENNYWSNWSGTSKNSKRWKKIENGVFGYARQYNFYPVKTCKKARDAQT